MNLEVNYIFFFFKDVHRKIKFIASFVKKYVEVLFFQPLPIGMFRARQLDITYKNLTVTLTCIEYFFFEESVLYMQLFVFIYEYLFAILALRFLT